MKKVICIKRNEFYAHHRKLEIGKTYLLQENMNGIYINSAYIQSLGFYPKDFFMSLEEFRDNQIDKILILENN
jgi:hypothetical protein